MMSLSIALCAAVVSAWLVLTSSGASAQTNAPTPPPQGVSFVVLGENYPFRNLSVTPFNTTTAIILDNYFGRQFNSLYDVKIHRQTGMTFFTDSPCGYLEQFRPQPLMPNQVYRFDPTTSRVRVVADGFAKCNGIAFSEDGQTAYVTDTGANAKFLGNNQTEPAIIYAFDVDPTTQAFKNHRVFAYVDTGLADGVQLDSKGSVYTVAGDGAQVWDSTGMLLGKFFLGTVSGDLVFTGKGQLGILAETAIYLAEIKAGGFNLSFP